MTNLEGYLPFVVHLHSSILKQISRKERDFVKKRIEEMEQTLNRIFSRFLDTKGLVEEEGKIAWQLNLDIFVIGDIYYNEIELLSFGARKALLCSALPKLEINFNSLSNEYVFELLQDIRNPFVEEAIPHIFIAGLLEKEKVVYDLSMKEFLACKSLYLCVVDNEGNLKLLEKWGKNYIDFEVVRRILLRSSVQY